MKVNFFKYEGTGNDFIIIDNRNNLITKEYNFIKKLCNRKYGIGADGLIIVENKNKSDIYMKYFNSDGKESSMCGNGGRCLISYLNKINVNSNFTFNAIDGIHNGFIKNNIIYIKMIDILIDHIKYYENNNNILINTGSPHYILFIDNNKNINNIDVYNEGKKIRSIYKYGVNVNFVKVINDNLLEIRTYERGVEDETFSCGTGVVASVISSSYLNKIKNQNIKVSTRGGNLNVSFEKNNKYYNNIWLYGPVNFIFEGFIKI